MSRSARLLAGLAALALLVAACGGSSSSAPGGATAEPGSTATAPAATEGATAAPTEAGGTVPDITTGAAALEDLSSYRMKVTMATQGLEAAAFAAFGEGLAMDATIVVKPEPAADMTVSMGTADQKLEMGYRVIGDKAWVNLGSWMEADSADAKSTMESFSPEKMFGGFSGMKGMSPVGEETKNGVATTHYAATGTDYVADLNEIFGLAGGTWTVDYWVAKDGGYPVAYAIEGKGADGGSFTMALEISDINSPSNVVEPPAGS